MNKPPFRETVASISQAVPAPTVQTYFPLNHGDVKHYEGSFFGSTYYSTYAYSQTFYNGRACFVETDSLDGSQAYFGFSGNALHMYGAVADGNHFQFLSPLTILDNSVLNGGGSLHSGTTFVFEGVTVHIDVTVTSNPAGTVSTPLGQAADCRTVSMAFTYSVPGDSETLETEDVWVLAPNVGKIKIAVVDQFMNQLGWLSITGGTVGGKAVAGIINPTAAEFTANPVNGIAPLVVSFTNQSTGTVTSTNWNFGDGSGSTLQNPSHTYTEAGTFSVILTVSGPYGSDTETKSNYISVTAPRKATVVTGAASAVTASSATLNGTITPNGSDASYYFQYGTSTGYGGQTATVAAGSGPAAVAASAPVVGLAPGTVYHFRLAGVNAAGTAYGEDKTFVTAALPPTVTTLAPSAVGPDGATSGGNVTSDGGAAVTARGVCWSTAKNPTVANSRTLDGAGRGEFSSLISGLAPGTAYHVRAYATNAAGTAYGEDFGLTTAPLAPTVATGSVSMQPGSSAVLYATVNPNGDAGEWYFEYGRTTDYDHATPIEDVGNGTAAVPVSAIVEDLLPDTVYHYRIVAANSIGTSYGADRMASTEILYVQPAGDCGGKTPCYMLIQPAAQDAGNLATVCIASGDYIETVDLGEAKALNFSGGWDDNFSAASGWTVIDGDSLLPLAIRKGSLSVKNLVLK